MEHHGGVKSLVAELRVIDPILLSGDDRFTCLQQVGQLLPINRSSSNGSAEINDAGIIPAKMMPSIALGIIHDASVGPSHDLTVGLSLKALTFFS